MKSPLPGEISAEPTTVIGLVVACCVMFILGTVVDIAAKLKELKK